MKKDLLKLLEYLTTYTDLVNSTGIIMISEEEDNKMLNEINRIKKKYKD